MTVVRVTCPNGHSEDFSNADVASSYCEYGHACVSIEQHKVEVISEEQAAAELVGRQTKLHAYQKSIGF